jgi:hypothetical protein
LKFIFINTVLTSCKNLGNFGVNQNRIAVEIVVVFGFYCEESVNLDLGPGNVLGEAFFFQLQGFAGGRVWRNRANRRDQATFLDRGFLPQGNRLKCTV